MLAAAAKSAFSAKAPALARAFSSPRPIPGRPPTARLRAQQPGWQAGSASWHLQYRKRKALRAASALSPPRGSHQAAIMPMAKHLAP